MTGVKKLPLSGLQVIEIGQNLAAPFAASILADMGADVLKIEKPEGGDDSRAWGPPFWQDGSPIFHYLNRNKSVLTLDLTNKNDFHRLMGEIGSADIFIHNMRPGVVEKLGLDDVSLRKMNERLIYAALGAFGHAGPLSQKPAYELLMQAFGGLMSITGEKDSPPVRTGPSMCDLGTGMWAAIGILSAVHQRHASGIGVTVDTSLYETAVSWSGIHLAHFAVSGDAPERQGTGHAQLCPYQLFETKTDPLIIAAGNDRLFVKFTDVLGRRDLASDKRFLTNADRVTNRAALIDVITPLISSEPKEVWEERLAAAGVPCASVNTIPKVFAHSQTKALQLLQTPEEGFPMVALPISFDGQRPAIRSIAPAFAGLSRSDTP